jgi:hypothetical protein
MKVRILVGPKTGEILHKPFGPETQNMIDSGFWECLPDAPKPVQPPRWFLFKGPLTEEYALAFQCPSCKATTIFTPQQPTLEAVAKVHAYCAHAVPVPNDVAEQYVLSGGGLILPPTEWPGDGPAVNKAQAIELAKPRPGR